MALELEKLDNCGRNNASIGIDDMDQFRADIDVHLSSIAASLERLQAFLDDETINSEQGRPNEVTESREEAENNRSRAIAAYAVLDRLLKEEALESKEKLAGWKASRQTSHLHTRSDRMERCAMAAAEIAVLAIEEVVETTIRAVSARKEAISIQVQRAGDATSNPGAG